MLYTKFQGSMFLGTEEEGFLMDFTIYVHGDIFCQQTAAFE